MSTASHGPAVTTSVPIQTFVALGPIDPDLVEPFLAPHQRLVLNPSDEDLAVADAAIVRAASTVDAAMLDRMPALKVLARTGVGTDLVDVTEAARRGIPVVITPGSNTTSVAEGVFAHLLAAVKRLSTLTALVREGRWNERGAISVGDLDDATLGIIGFNLHRQPGGTDRHRVRPERPRLRSIRLRSRRLPVRQCGTAVGRKRFRHAACTPDRREPPPDQRRPPLADAARQRTRQLQPRRVDRPRRRRRSPAQLDVWAGWGSTCTTPNRPSITRCSTTPTRC